MWASCSWKGWNFFSPFWFFVLAFGLIPYFFKAVISESRVESRPPRKAAATTAERGGLQSYIFPQERCEPPQNKCDALLSGFSRRALLPCRHLSPARPPAR